jgi:hypothetical protein
MGEDSMAPPKGRWSVATASALSMAASAERMALMATRSRALRAAFRSSRMLARMGPILPAAVHTGRSNDRG